MEQFYYLKKSNSHYYAFIMDEPLEGEYGIHSETGEVFLIDKDFYNPWVRQKVVASTENLQGAYSLKVSDCDNIFGIFNVNSLAEEYAENENSCYSNDYDGFKNGFKKHAELSKEMKFTYSDMINKAYSVAFHIGANYQDLVNKGKHDEAQQYIEEQNLLFIKGLSDSVDKIRIEIEQEGSVYKISDDGYLIINQYDFQKNYLRNHN